MEASINAPHANDPDPDDFFAEDDGDAGQVAEAEAVADAVAAEPSPADAPADTPAAEETPAPPDPAPAPETPKEEAVAAQTPPEEEAAQPKAETEPPADAVQAAPATQRPTERPYHVFRELVLSKETLQKLIEYVDGGGDPMVVYSEVETVQARNDVHAIKAVYAGHRQQIGDTPRLVPVSARAWKPRQIQPRKRVEENIDIV